MQVTDFSREELIEAKKSLETSIAMYDNQNYNEGEEEFPEVKNLKNLLALVDEELLELDKA